MADSRPNLLLEFSLLLCLAVLWGSSYLWIKIAVDAIPPVTLIAVRVSVAAIMLLGVVAWLRLDLPGDAATWSQLTVQSVLNSTGAWLLLAWGQQFVDSGLAGVLNSTSPLFVLAFTMLWTRHEPITGLKQIGVACGFAGVLMIVGFDVLQGLGQQVGAQLAILAGAVMYAGAAIFGKQRFNHLHPTATAAGTMICASVCLVPLSLTIDRPWTLTPTATDLAAALILGVFCTGFALLLYFRLLRTIGSMGVASQGFMRAGLSVLLGVVVLGEQLTVLLAFGVVSTILGVALINFPNRQITRWGT
ncbi:MAG: DMT family transporter [Hyphomicrobiaceae bacterium]